MSDPFDRVITRDEYYKLKEVSEKLDTIKYDDLDATGYSLVRNHWLARDWDDASGQRLLLTKKAKAVLGETSI